MYLVIQLMQAPRGFSKPINNVCAWNLLSRFHEMRKCVGLGFLSGYLSVNPAKCLLTVQNEISPYFKQWTAANLVENYQYGKD